MPEGSDGNWDGMIRLAVLQGDGIGPEIMGRRWPCCGLSISSAWGWPRLPGGAGRPGDIAHRRHDLSRSRVRGGEATPTASFSGRSRITNIRRSAEGGLNPSGELRKRLDLYANIRPARSRARLSAALRQAGRSRHRAREHRRLLLRPLDASRPRRVHADARPRPVGAQDHPRGLDAHRRGGVPPRRTPPTQGDGRAQGQRAARVRRRCFSSACARWRSAIRDVAYEERIIDAMAALLVRDASAFDVIVTTNMFGDILSDEASEIAGSLGLAASINAGDDSCAWRRPSTARRPTSRARTSPIRRR